MDVKTKYVNFLFLQKSLIKRENIQYFLKLCKKEHYIMYYMKKKDSKDAIIDQWMN